MAAKGQMKGYMNGQPMPEFQKPRHNDHKFPVLVNIPKENVDNIIIMLYTQEDLKGWQDGNDILTLQERFPAFVSWSSNVRLRSDRRWRCSGQKRKFNRKNMYKKVIVKKMEELNDDGSLNVSMVEEQVMRGSEGKRAFLVGRQGFYGEVTGYPTPGIDPEALWISSEIVHDDYVFCFLDLKG